jgi:hypothetical protein
MPTFLVLNSEQPHHGLQPLRLQVFYDVHVLLQNLVFESPVLRASARMLSTP